MNKHTLFKALLWGGVLIIIAIAIDQISKLLAVQYLKDSNEIPLIGNLVVLQYLENKGAAFGILQNKRIFFLVMTIIVIFVIAWICYRMPTSKHYRPLRITLAMLAAGAIGNMIDRILYGYVVDFIYIKCIDFPIFNIADCYLTVTMVVLFIQIVFCYTDEELSFLKRKKHQKNIEGSGTV